MKTAILLLFLFGCFSLNAQYCETFGLTLEDEIELGCAKNTVTVLHDQMDRDYLYASNTTGGLTILDASNPTDLTEITNLSVDVFDGYTVNRVTQEGNYLYVAIGSLFGAHDEPSGLAIVNVENPEVPFVTDVWTSTENGGTAYVGIDGHLAFVCGLSNGVIVLNISDKSNITFVSQYIPPMDWPEGTDIDKIKARHIVFDGDQAYLAYDAGGMRILDISNPAELSEIGRYSNPALNGAARAYNNILKRENLLYVAVDYAGMEILDVSNVEDVVLHGWWNPNGFPLESPAATSWRWFSSPWHTNEIEMIDDCGIVFLSAGRTDLVGIDISDPSTPELCGHYGDSTDNEATYGMTVYNNRIYMGYICAVVPFPGDWAGVKSVVYDSDCPLKIEHESKLLVNLYPNPTNHNFYIDSPQPVTALWIYDLSGKQVRHETSPNPSQPVEGLDPGIYLIRMNIEGNWVEKKLIIQ